MGTEQINTKYCYKCKTVKLKSDFYKNKSKYDGLTSECKECIKIINKENKKRFPERTKKLDKAYRERNKEQIAKKAHEKYLKNKKQILVQQKVYAQKNKEKIKKYRDEYRLKNKAKIKEKTHNYNLTKQGKFTAYKGKAKLKNIEFKLTKKQFESFWQKPCTYCGDPIETIGIDRIDSSKGYTIENCNSCCQKCNASKSDKSLKDWLARMKQILKQCESI